MSFLVRNIGRALTQTTKTVSSSLVSKPNQTIQSLSRPLSILSKTGSTNRFPNHSCTTDSCKCGVKGIHTKGDRELVEFLQDEIVEEKKTVVNTGLPSQVGDFLLKKNKAELILSRKFNDETVTITLNVNHSIDVQENESPDNSLESRPDFEVDIKSNEKTLSFTCQFTNMDDLAEGQQEQETEDNSSEVFGITEVTFYKGEFNEEGYCVSGDSLDSKLYDLLMNALEERGISNDFANILIDICTSHEHSMYINLLENVQQFFRKK